MINSYKILKKQKYENCNYSIVPIRYEDRFLIMKWRNEQIYHLRQREILTTEKQDKYFNDIIGKSFNDPNPSQILFSFLYKNKCIGYGGLVHINWLDKNSEISFIINTELENNEFDISWDFFLNLIEKVAFEDLNLHKIYTFAFDLRPRLYLVLEKNNYNKEAILIDHSYFNNKFIDVVIHSKINAKLKD